MNMKTLQNIMSDAHKLAKQLQADENIKRYHKALSIALINIWHDAKQMQKAKTAFNQEEKEIILNASKQLNPFSWSLVLYYANHSKLIEKLTNYAYKDGYFWHDKKGHSLYFSNEFINAIR